MAELARPAEEYSGGPRAGAPLPPVPLLGFVIATAAVIFIAMLAYRTLQTRSAASARVARTIQVMDELQAVLSFAKDTETGQRGFLLTGEESYLEPYTNARVALRPEIARVRDLLVDDPVQQQRLDALEEVINAKLAELESTIVRRRSGDVAGALGLVRTGRGKIYMERIRALVGQMETTERTALSTRERDWQNAEQLSSNVTFGGSAMLLLLITAAAYMASRDYRARRIQAWLRLGQMAFTRSIQGEHRLEALGESVLAFLGHYLGASVGAAYMAEGSGQFRRFAGYALDNADQEVIRPGEGLLGQAAKEHRPLHVKSVPPGYLPVVSATGRADARELLIAPAVANGSVHALLELGFFRQIQPEDEELLARISEALAVAVRSSRDRTRLTELLEETQQQGEELQMQQEELRVNNEELEVQSRTLKDSQAQLESQQVELEQSNSQLQQQTQILEYQKDELESAQAILAQRAADLERANQYKSEFLANMSHELRTPLNSSLILAKILSENRAGNLSPEQVRYAQTISSAGNDLLTIINDILDLSKIEAGKVELAVETVALSRVLDTLTKTFQPVAQQRGLGFSVSLAPGTPERLETDAQRLGQILKNLISNALKFTEQGEVSVQVSPGASHSVQFAVRDTGIGISEHQQNIIFDAFRQADGSTHRRYGGTGLGLTISKDLARLLGGEIQVASIPGTGSVFTLTLPQSLSDAAAAPAATISGAVASAGQTPRRLPAEIAGAPSAAAVPRQPTALSGWGTPAPASIEDDSLQLKADSPLIVVVEDDATFATILRDMTRELGFQCVVAHTAADGLAAVATYRPKAVLLDMHLPDSSGLSVLDQLKRNPHLRHIPVHVVSVADHSQEALALGAVGYALKPVKREELVDGLRKLEAKFSAGLRRVLVVEDDERQSDSIRELLQIGDVQITASRNAADALQRLREMTFDCIVLDLNLPDVSGYELLQRMAEQDEVAFPPVIVYTGRSLTRDEEQALRRFSRSIIIKDARSPERLLDEVTLFLHQVESKLPLDRQRMLQTARNREAALEDRRILVVEDDVRNIFALSSLLEPKGAVVQIARNGREALEALTASSARGAEPIDLVLMDIMMPEMDGLTAMREIRKRPEWKKLPIIALTAKAMRDDQERCLAAGASDYIAKPLDVEKLLSLVRVWMPK